MRHFNMRQEEEIVIVGGGICGLATALALHRKGLTSMVLERSSELRASGAGIRIWDNGWRALHQLGIASLLRKTASLHLWEREICLDEGLNKQTSFGNNESRCLRRSDLINALANALPLGTIRYECEVVNIKSDSSSSCSVIQLLDGRSIMAKILIGCDGSKSVVAEFLNLSTVKEFGLMEVRGLTNYPNSHPFSGEFRRIMKSSILVGLIPIDDLNVYWFVTQQSSRYNGVDSTDYQDHVAILISTLESLEGFPIEIMQMIKESDLDSISQSSLRYRDPWALLTGKFRKGNVTIAGDAMHVMGPFLGQGGSAALEDAVVLARCLARRQNKVEEAIDMYLGERRMRVTRLSMQAYLIGLLSRTRTSVMVRFASIVLMAILFNNPNDHIEYDCGVL